MTGRPVRSADRESDAGVTLRHAFEACNHRDVDTLLGLVADDVVWPGDEGCLHGKAALSAYWSRQWAAIRTEDHVLDVREALDGSVVASIDQLVPTLDGDLVSRTRKRYAFIVENGVILKLVTRDADGGGE